MKKVWTPNATRIRTHERGVHWLILLVPLMGCAGGQANVQEPTTCNQELSGCRFTLENLQARQRSPSTASDGEQDARLFLREWRAAYGEIGARLEGMFRGYDYKIFIDNGTLVFALPLSTLFLPKKAVLTEQGKEIALRINQIAKLISDRRIVISCRSVDFRVSDPTKPAALDRELSFKRAMTFTTKLVKTGIDPTTLGAAGYPGEVNEETGQGEGWFELLVLPHPREMPAFPDDFLQNRKEAALPRQDASGMVTP